MTPESIANAWIDAFNRHDLEALLALYAEDAVHNSPKLRVARPETEGKVRGKAALRSWWQDAFDRLPGLRYELKTVTASSHRVFIEYIRTVPGESALAVAEVFTLRDGKIAASAVYHG